MVEESMSAHLYIACQLILGRSDSDGLESAL